MGAQVVQLRSLVRSGWSSNELAQLYRVESALIQSGLRIETCGGLSDEGDPWFAFCRPDDGEVIVHVARIQGVYILASAAYAQVASGCDITAMVRDLIERHPLVQMSGQGRGANVFLHPITLLIAVVAAAFFKNSEARASSPSHVKMADSRGEGGRPEPTSSFDHKTFTIKAEQGAVVLSAIMTALAQDDPLNKTVPTESDTALHAALLDSSVFSMGAKHVIDSSSKLPEFQGDDGVLNAPLAGSVPGSHQGTVGEAFSIFTLAFDLANIEGPRATFVNETGAAPLIEYSPATNGDLALSLTLAPSAPDGAFPTIHSASLSANPHSGAYPKVVSAVPPSAPMLETNTLNHPEQLSSPQPDQLSSALVAALKLTSHTLIEVPAGGTTQFATALINLLTHHNPNASTNADPIHLSSASSLATSQNSATGTATSPPSASAELDHAPVGSGVVSATPAPTSSSLPTSIDVSATQASNAPSSTAIPTGAVNAQMLVQEFFVQTAHFQTIDKGLHIIVYDADAIVAHAPQLASVTFDFSDGSTLSLVGLPAALHLPVIV